MVAIAIIPARIGSKRLCRKNILDFFGKPMIAHTIEAAKQADVFDTITVSSDSEDILDIARSCGVEAYRRSDELGGDTVGVVDVCLDVLNAYEKAGGTYDVMGCLYATAPLRTAQDIISTMGLLDGKSDFGMAVCDYQNHPLQAIKVVEPDSADHVLQGRPMFPELLNGGLREHGNLVVSNGSTYAVRTDAFRRLKTFYGPELGIYKMPPERSIDINTELDLEIAELMWRKAHNSV